MHNVFQEKGYIQIKAKNKINCCFNLGKLCSPGENYNRVGKKKRVEENPNRTSLKIGKFNSFKQDCSFTEMKHITGAYKCLFKIHEIPKHKN